MAKDQAKLLRFRCPRCQAALRVSMKVAGRYITCVKCNHRIPVPASQKEADEEAKMFEVKSLAYEVPKNCMKCKARIPKGAVICIECGFDYREGKQLEVEDFTIKEGDKVRGGVALQYLIVEAILVIVATGLIIYRLKTDEPLWYELACYLSALFSCLALMPAHFIQWNNYSELPIRDHALKLEEDRAERDEAREPYGYLTAPVVLGCILVGFAIALPTWGGDHWTWTKETMADAWQWVNANTFGEAKPAGPESEE